MGSIGSVLGRRILEKTAKSRLKLFEKYLNGKKILDVGLGSGSMAHIISIKDFDVKGIDVTETSLYPELKPIIYDGENIPSKDEKYDVGLLICVLHHCPKQLKVLEETMRVSKRVIIIEDTYRSVFEKMMISARDSVGNFEFYPHEYRSTSGWQEIFKNKGWKVIHKKEWSSVAFYGMYGRQTLFVIEKDK